MTNSNSKLTPIDKIIILISIIGLLILLILPFLYYGDLPDKIPKHFNGSGQADSWGDKSSLWTLPIIGTVLFVGLNYLIKYPFSFNTIEKKNSIKSMANYSTELRIVRTVTAFVTCSFAYITYATIQTALGNKTGLGSYFIIIFLVVVLSIVGYGLVSPMRD